MWGEDMQPAVEPILVVLGIVLAAVVLFVTEWLSADLVALLVLVALAGTGVLTPEEAIAGFSSTATLTVLAMFVLSAGVYRTGAVNVLANRLHRLGAGKEVHVVLAMALIVGPVSAFINNTAAVAILIPLAVALAAEGKRAPSRYLIPLSYASQMGGVITLIGTSTNILASTISARSGHRPMGMFEFAPAGIVIFLVGLVYLTFIAPRLLPHRGKAEESAQREFRARVVVREGTSAVGVLASSKDAELRLGGRVVGVRRAGHALAPAEAELQAGDIVSVEGVPYGLLHAEAGGSFVPAGRTRLPEGMPVEEGYSVVEVVVSPGSSFVGPETGLSLLETSDVFVIGLLHKERLAPDWFAPEVDAGDSLLVLAPKSRMDELRDHPDLILVNEVPLTEFKRDRIPHVLAIFVGVIGLAAFDVLPIVVTALGGAALMVLTRILTMREFYRAVRWDVVLLLAGLVPLGTALVKTGGADAAAAFFTGFAGHLPGWAVLLTAYVVTALMTEVLSNNGTVVLMVPVTVSVALGLGYDPTPFVLAVAYAASTSFMTPVGYQTNTMVYGPGGYRFFDFLRVGAPLNLVLALVTTATLSVIYGLV